jgi:phenylacetate-CoA ligase
MFKTNLAFPELLWPPVFTGPQASLAALLFQLERSQWWSPQCVADHQFLQAESVVAHAFRTVPYYRTKYAEAGLESHRFIAARDWDRVPVIGRREIQSAGSLLHSTNVPKRHGRIGRNVTSGSTGMPITSLTTQVTRGVWRAITLRDHLWHRRDFGQSLATIREATSHDAKPPRGKRVDNWGVTRGLIESGPAFLLTSQASLEEQAKWLLDINPGYVLAYPSTLVALAEYFSDSAIRLSNLREIRCFGETLDHRSREQCATVFGVNVVDLYSSQELGYVALQCPEQHAYHIQTESVLVEILTEEGRVCQPGEVGRVVVTTLQNFAMPLIRYDLGDYAEVGKPCDCGRGLPVLKRILGRQRNMFTLPDGRRIWPSWADAPSAGFQQLPPVSQFQIVQTTTETIEARLVVSRPLTPEEESGLKRMLTEGVGYPFSVSFKYVDSIPRSPNGKFEDFRSEVSHASTK